MQCDRPKQYLALRGKTVIEQTLARLAEHPQVCGIVVALARQDPYWPALQLHCSVPVVTVDGGAQRVHSVTNGLRYLAQHQALQDWVLVHDAARPCVRSADISQLIKQVIQHQAGGLLAMPVRDTMKQSSNAINVTQTVDRSQLWHAFTPQMFRIGELLEAIHSAQQAGYSVTDESSAMESVGIQPLLVQGASDNIKITRPEDLPLAQLYLKLQESQS